MTKTQLLSHLEIVRVAKGASYHILRNFEIRKSGKHIGKGITGPRAVQMAAKMKLPVLNAAKEKLWYCCRFWLTTQG